MTLMSGTRTEDLFFFNTFLQIERHPLGDGFGGRRLAMAGGDMMAGARRGGAAWLWVVPMSRLSGGG